MDRVRAEAEDRAQAPLLAMRSITKQFPGVLALAGVSLDVSAGEVHAIVGENGAGKSTLMKILSGVHRPTSGEILWEGIPVDIGGPRAAQRLGIRMVYQELSLIPDLTVAENIALRRMPTRGPFLAWSRMIDQADEALDLLGVTMDVGKPVGALSISQRQLVEIARVVSAGARLIVLDEPTSSLSEHEAQNLLRVVRKLSHAGIAVVFISHRLHEVLDVADQVTVMRDGRTVVSSTARGTTVTDMVRAMVGRDLDEVFPKTEVEPGEIVFQTQHLSSEGSFVDVSLYVRSGEIVGLAGLVGAGRTEIARAIFGLDRFDSGSVLIKGQKLSGHRPVTSIRHGIAYVPEDRRELGIVPPLTVRENLTLSVLGKISRLGFLSRVRERKLSQALVSRFGIQPANPEARIDNLSGGNQQKAVLGRWVETGPTLLILDEPTRGVDVGAKAEIHRLIGQLAADGLGVILISSELPEILAVSDRIYVLHEGVVSAEISREEATEVRVMAAATGTTEHTDA